MSPSQRVFLDILTPRNYRVVWSLIKVCPIPPRPKAPRGHAVAPFLPHRPLGDVPTANAEPRVLSP
jgi:hypothetical protein